jgi:hypothetical protein
MSELRTHLALLGYRVPLTMDDRLSGKSTQSNLVLLGGSDANAISRTVLARTRTTFKSVGPARHAIASGAVNGLSYAAATTGDSVDKDVCLARSFETGCKRDCGRLVEVAGLGWAEHRVFQGDMRRSRCHTVAA